MLGVGAMRWRAFLLFVILGLVVAACGTPEEADPPPEVDDPVAEEQPEVEEDPADDEAVDLIPITVGIVPGATSLPAQVAKGAGIFERNGLDVTFEIVTNLATLPGAMGRQFDFGMTTQPDIINANIQGIEVVVVSGSAYDDLATETAGVVVPADSAAEGPSDLEGLTVGVLTLGGNVHPATLFWLRESGVDPDSITFVEIPAVSHFDQLQAGAVDAVQTIEPFKGQISAEGGRVLVDPMDVIIQAYGLETISFLDFMAERSWAEENPDVLEGWVASLQEAIGFIENNEEEARSIMSDILGLPPEVTSTFPLNRYGTEVSPLEIEAMADVMKRNDDLDEGYEVDVDALVITPDANLTDQR